MYYSQTPLIKNNAVPEHHKWSKKTPCQWNSIFEFCAVRECILLLFPNKVLILIFCAVSWLNVQFRIAQECRLFKQNRDSCDTDRTTNWLAQQKINNFVLLWNGVFWTLIWANFVMWEKQPVLFCAALNYIKRLCCLGNAIFISSSQKSIFVNN